MSATAGSFYQSPRFIERAADPSNFGLGSERVDHVSLGANWRFGDRWTVLVEGYARQLDDLVTAGDSVTGRVVNAGEGTSHGVDLVVNREFARGWSANAVYSYNDVTLNDNDGAGDYPADYNHQHMVGVGARWEISERWQVGARWKYATGRPRDEFVERISEGYSQGEMPGAVYRASGWIHVELVPAFLTMHPAPPKKWRA